MERLRDAFSSCSMWMVSCRIEAAFFMRLNCHHVMETDSPYGALRPPAGVPINLCSHAGKIGVIVCNTGAEKAIVRQHRETLALAN